MSARRKVSKKFQGSVADIEAAVTRYGEKFAGAFGASTVDVQYGVFQYQAERVVGQGDSRKPEMQFLVTATFLLDAS